MLRPMFLIVNAIVNAIVYAIVHALGLVDIFEIFPDKGHMKALIYRSCSQKSIFWRVNFKPKIPYLRNRSFWKVFFLEPLWQISSK